MKLTRWLVSQNFIAVGINKEYHWSHYGFGSRWWLAWRVFAITEPLSILEFCSLVHDGQAVPPNLSENSRGLWPVGGRGTWRHSLGALPEPVVCRTRRVCAAAARACKHAVGKVTIWGLEHVPKVKMSLKKHWEFEPKSGWCCKKPAIATEALHYFTYITLNT